MVDGCVEKSHSAQLHQKQALQVAAIRDWKNTNHDQSLKPRSASNSAWNQSWPKRQEVPSGTQTITQLRRARTIVTGMTPQLGRLLYVTLIQSKLDYASILTPVDGVERSELVRLDVRFFKTILGISLQPHHVLKLREMVRIEAPYWRR